MKFGDQNSKAYVPKSPCFYVNRVLITLVGSCHQRPHSTSGIVDIRRAHVVFISSTNNRSRHKVPRIKGGDTNSRPPNQTITTTAAVT